MAGLMYTDVSLKLRLGDSADPLQFKAGESWIDPMIGLRYRAPLGQRWEFESSGQVGGFGIGADLTWQLSISVDYRMTRRTSLMLGYRYVDFDFEDGEGQDRFRFDIAEHGFLVGLRFGL
jgi:opacity protein-like surface antigen